MTVDIPAGEYLIFRPVRAQMAQLGQPQTCAACGETKPLTDEFFYRAGRGAWRAERGGLPFRRKFCKRCQCSGGRRGRPATVHAAHTGHGWYRGRSRLAANTFQRLAARLQALRRTND